MAETPTHKSITHMILGIVGANLALDLMRSFHNGVPKMAPVGEGTGIYVFRPSRGGGKAIIRVDGAAATISTITGGPRQRQRIQREVRSLFPPES